MKRASRELEIKNRASLDLEELKDKFETLQQRLRSKEAELESAEARVSMLKAEESAGVK